MDEVLAATSAAQAKAMDAARATGEAVKQIQNFIKGANSLKLAVNADARRGKVWSATPTEVKRSRRSKI